MSSSEVKVGVEPAGRPARSRYDAFLSYHWPERESVEPLAAALRERGLHIFFDRWYLTPGRPWVVALEDALGRCRVALIFIGPAGLGPWQQRECDFALDRQVREPDHTVVPVLLPGSDPPLGFLRQLTWIDLRGGLSDPAALDDLVAVVEGRPVERPIAPSDLCPYRGLRPFREEDADFFFGRDTYVERLRDVVGKRRVVAVVGASGSGKSSVVRAGLVPHLRRGERGEVWEIVTLLPGEHPVRALAASLLPFLEPGMTEAERLGEVGRLTGLLRGGEVSLAEAAARLLARQTGTQNLLLVIDQWEEVYTLCHDVEERTRFIDLVLEAADRRALTVVLTLRGDFYGRALEHRGLADVLESGVISLGPMLRPELELAIGGPAERAGLAFEPGLVDRICDDVEEEPGNLPLLEFVLTALWEERRGRWLVHAAYERMGELRGAIAERAESLYAELSEAERNLLPAAFLHLIRPGESHADTRQRARLSALDPAARPVVERFVEARLLITGLDEATGEETLEVAHETLLRNWARLQDWVNADREFLIWRQRFRFAMDEWERGGRDREALLRGLMLYEAERWRRLRPAAFAGPDGAYLEASRKARNSRRVRRTLTIGGGAVSALLVLLLGLVMRRASAAEEEARMAGLLQTVAGETDPLLAALALRDLSTPREPPDGIALARRLADAVAEHLPYEVYGLPAGTEVLTAGFAVGTDAAVRVATWTKPDTLRFWPRLGAGRSFTLRGHRGYVSYAAFSRDGSLLATGGDDGTVRLWSTVATEGNAVAVFPSGRESTPLPPVLEVAFSPDGSRVAAVYDGGVVRIWNRAGGAALAVFAGGPTESVTAVAFSSDGRRLGLLYGDGSVSVRTPDGGETGALGGSAGVAGFALPGSGDRLVAAHRDGSLRRWDLSARGSPRDTVLDAHSVGGRIVASPDGSLFLTSASAQPAHVWSETAAKRRLLSPHRGFFGAAFDEANRALLTYSPDTVRVWRLDIPPEPVAFRGHSRTVWSAEFSPNGTRILTASDDGTLRLWSAGDPVSQLAEFRRDDQEFQHARFSPDGERIAAVTQGGDVFVCDGALRRCSVADRYGVAAQHVEFSPDGQWITVGGDRIGEGNVRLISAGGETVTELGQHDEPVRRSRFSPDGGSLVTASADSTAVIWEIESRRKIFLRAHSDEVRDARFNRAGTRVVTASLDGTARIWDARTGRGVGQPLVHGFAVEIAAFTPDGARVVTGTRDGRILVAPADGTGRPITLGRMGGRIDDLHFDSGGRHVAAASADGTVRIWSLEGRGHPQVLVLGGPARSVRFSGDGRRVLTAGGPDTEITTAADVRTSNVRLWRVTWDDLLQYLRDSSRICLDTASRVRFFNESAAEADDRNRRCTEALVPPGDAG
jgi:WD40 repeat protein